MNTAAVADDFLTVAEAAEALKVSERAMRYLLARGEVRAVRLSRRIVRIPRAELERLATCGAAN